MKKTAIIFLLAITVILAWYFCSTEQYNGVDISHHNRVNWEALSNDSNIQFCYIKATEGKSYKDSECLGNVKEANKRNLHVGIYHYFSTHTSVKAQFDNFISVYKRVKTDLIPAIDVEKKGNVYDSRPVSELTNIPSFILGIWELIEHCPSSINVPYGIEPCGCQDLSRSFL